MVILMFLLFTVSVLLWVVKTSFKSSCNSALKSWPRNMVLLCCLEPPPNIDSKKSEKSLSPKLPWYCCCLLPWYCCCLAFSNSSACFQSFPYSSYFFRRSEERRVGKESRCGGCA